MKLPGVTLSVALSVALTACGPSEPELPAGARRLTEAEKPKVVPREHFAVPLEERPVLGQAGDTTCATGENEFLIVMDDRRCLSLLKDTVKPDSAAAGVKLARLRAAFFQPGPREKNETVGWVLYATRSDCAAKQVTVIGNVIYRPDGVEISRAIPEGGPLSLPEGLAVTKLLEGVCDS